MDVFSEDNSITYNWNDDIYYFCTQHCREEFEKLPGACLKKIFPFQPASVKEKEVKNKVTNNLKGYDRCSVILGYNKIS